jgi:integrase
MAAARSHPDLRTRLVVEMLARTGLRAGELCGLAADAVTQIGDNHWLRVPLLTGYFSTTRSRGRFSTNSCTA